jgi:hypothetical protein
LVRHYSVILLLLWPFCLAIAGGSIYSANGLGETLVLGSARTVGLGGGGLALADTQGANFSNPALVALIPNTQVALGGRLAFWSTTSGGQTDADAESGWELFQLCFPVSPVWKVGLCLVPTRRMDVRTFRSAEFAQEYQAYEERIRNAGGEAEAQFVTGVHVSRLFSCGLTVGYAFRRLERWTTVDFSSSDWQDAEFHFDDSWHSWIVTAGALVQPLPRLSIGALFRPRQTGTWISDFSYIHQDSVAETRRSVSGPGEWGAGMAFEFVPGWMAVGDGRFGLWKKGDLGPNDPRTPVAPYWLSLGVERLARAGTRISPMQKWGCRGGLFYRRQYWPEQNGETVTDIGGALGFSVPAPAQRGVLHFAGEVGRRGSESYGALETFVRFSLTVEMNERWFQRTKPRTPQ